MSTSAPPKLATPLSPATNFALGLVCDHAMNIGCGIDRQSLFAGLEAMMGLSYFGQADSSGSGAELMETFVGNTRFYADRRRAGVELSGVWRLEYETPPFLLEVHRVIVRQRIPPREWLIQDPPSGLPSQVFFRVESDGGISVTRKIHFSLGKPWDPERTKPADTGYSADGSVCWTRSFHDGKPRPSPSQPPALSLPEAPVPLVKSTPNREI